jgi:2-polyprenyl-3-methyl-5-hydroxy-6-metoxy-1,4-benzoquinol methylase
MSSNYYEHDRPEVVALVPLGARRVLELGCASGRLAEALKQRQDCHVTGVEYSAEAAARATARLDRVIVGDCESLDLDAQFQPGEFDCLIAADVLEHLRDPESLLRNLRPFLTQDAAIVVSLPNVRHGGVLEAAVEGYWTYREEGILDRTHLRFFTRREIDNMFARLGFEVEEQRTVDDPMLTEWVRLGRPTAPTFGAMTLNGLDEEEIREFFVVQWLVRSRPVVRPPFDGATATPDKTGGGAGLFPRITLADNEIQELNSRLIRESQHAQRVQAELTCREEALANKVREGEVLRRQLVKLSMEHESLTAAYNAVLCSPSWRLTGPLRHVLRLWGLK